VLRKRSLSISLGLAAIFACGDPDDESDPLDSCTKGFSLLVQVEAELRSGSAPTCSSAADCTFLSLRAECNGSQVNSCGTVVHRDVLARYSQEQTNARFCALMGHSKYGCSAGPSCIATRVACEAGRCVAQLIPAPAP
jgi:hypothetical protein